jgi:septal ring factor EnvC (AmiA/AmiB activator)
MRIKINETEFREISDEEILKIIEIHKKEREQKQINENAMTEVSGAVSILEQQLNELKTTVKGLEKKIKESQDKIDEAI